MNKKINISIIGTRGYPYVYSGYETFVKELSERLVLKDCNVTIYCHKGLFVSIVGTYTSLMPFISFGLISKSPLWQ